MGYHTKLNSDGSCSILKKQCIAELSVSLILFYLEGFITRFASQKKDYSAAINIWNYDINMIKREYEG